MDNVIAEYQKWKLQGETLRAQAKQAMEGRFRDILTEAAKISQDYQRDFGSPLKPPAGITAFRFKPVGAKAVKKSKAIPAKPMSAKAAVPDPKVAALQKRLAQAQGKLEAAKAGGKPTKNLEDRIYEIEDEIRLATANA
jgi:hypothetical protein